MEDLLEENILLSYICYVSNIKIKNISLNENIYTIEHDNNVRIFDDYSDTMLVCKQPLQVKFLENNDKIVKIKINKV